MASKTSYNDTIFDQDWTHKYAPKSISEMVLSKDVREKVNEFIEEKDFPTLLFCGRPGQGKTTLANLLCKEIPTSVLFINASQENGMETVRGKIMSFSETMSSFGDLKVIILDEADRLSNQAQDALRGIIESNAAHTRFILTANELSRLTDAIQSRCTPINITPTRGGFAKYICDILKKENIKVPETEMPNLRLLIATHFPDLRKTIRVIQLCCRKGVLKINSASLDKTIAVEIASEIEVSDDVINIRKIWLDKESDFQGDYQFVMKRMHQYYYTKNDLSPIERAKVILEIADGLRDSVNVIDQELNFYAVVLRIMRALKPELGI